MPISTAVSKFTIKIDGAEIDGLSANLIEAVVDTDLQMPDMCTIDLFDSADPDSGDFTWADHASIDLGKAVVISATSDDIRPGGQVTGDLFTGEITSIEPHFDEGGRCVLRIRGYAQAHRMHRGRKTVTYLKMSDKDVASKLFGNSSVTTDKLTDTKIKYDYIIQNNQTDMEFLMSRARRIGFYIATGADGKVSYLSGADTLGDGPQLKWGSTLISFRPRATAVQQADKAASIAWDVTAFKTQDGKISSTKFGAQGGSKLKLGGTASKAAYKADSEIAVSHIPLFDVDDAKAVAQAALDRANAEYIQAEGVCLGDPNVRAGWKVDIQNVGDRFSGKYFVTSARHVWHNGVYNTYFTISGYEPHTLTHLLSSQSANNEERQGIMRGVVVGKVTDMNDPDKLGRIKVNFPWLGKDAESDWARIAVPMSGKEAGLLFMPEIDDEVLLSFDRGDPNYPYVVGFLWNGKEVVPEGADGPPINSGKIDERVIVSRTGHIIAMVDKKGAEKIVIRDKTGKNEIIIDSKKDSMFINVTKDLKITAGGEIHLTAKKDIKVNGDNIKFDAKTKFDVKAGSGGAVVKSSAGNIVMEAMQIKGKGSTGIEFKAGGAVVKIGPVTVNVNNGALEVM